MSNLKTSPFRKLLNKKLLLTLSFALIIVSTLSIITIVKPNDAKAGAVLLTIPSSLSITTTGSGVVTGSAAPQVFNAVYQNSSSKQAFNTGTTISLAAQPAAGSVFTGWTGACTGTATTCSFVLNTSKTVTATFITKPVVVVPPPVVTPPVVTPPTTTPPVTPPTTTSPTYVDPYASSSAYFFVPSTTGDVSAIAAGTMPAPNTFSGFGVSALVDSCSSYANAQNDIGKILPVIQAQITSLWTNRFLKESCQKTASNPSASCIATVDTINNLLLTYSTYMVEYRKISVDKSLTCKANGTKTGKLAYDWFNSDLASVAYASVRDLYVSGSVNPITNKYYANSIVLWTNGLTDALVNNAAKNFMVATNANATGAKPYVDTGDKTPLRTLAFKSFSGTWTSPAVATSSSIVAPALSIGSAPFFVVGQVENMTNRTLGVIALPSFAAYVNTFNTSPTIYGDLYSTANRPLRAADQTIMDNLQKVIDQKSRTKMTAMGLISQAPVPTTVAEVAPVTQKASVLDAIENWFGGVWSFIGDMFGGLFGVRKAGAQSSNYSSCSGTDPKDKPKLLKTGAIAIPNLINFRNYYSLIPEKINVIAKTTITPGDKASLSPYQRRFVDNVGAWNMRIGNDSFTQSTEPIIIEEDTEMETYTSPFNCLKDAYLQPPLWKFLNYKNVSISSVIEEQSASLKTFDMKPEFDYEIIGNGAAVEQWLADNNIAKYKATAGR